MGAFLDWLFPREASDRNGAEVRVLQASAALNASYSDLRRERDANIVGTIERIVTRDQADRLGIWNGNALADRLTPDGVVRGDHRIVRPAYDGTHETTWPLRITYNVRG